MNIKIFSALICLSVFALPEASATRQSKPSSINIEKAKQFAHRYFQKKFRYIGKKSVEIKKVKTEIPKEVRAFIVCLLVYQKFHEMQKESRNCSTIIDSSFNEKFQLINKQLGETRNKDGRFNLIIDEDLYHQVVEYFGFGDEDTRKIEDVISNLGISIIVQRCPRNNLINNNQLVTKNIFDMILQQ